ncbi:MAG: hypothetical protein V3R30_15370, partial [Kiloniellales bacterium]
ALRQLLEAASTPERLRALWQRNLVTLAMLKRNLPALKTDGDQHYADILTSLYKRRLREMHEEVSRRQGGGGIARTHGMKEPASRSAQETVARQKGDAAQREKPIPQGKKETGSVPDQGTRVETESAPGQIDKSALPISAPRRIRDKEHLRYVAHQPCLICGRSPGHAHHLRFAQPRALGRKVSDEWVVPLCATHHRALHGVGDEERWWKERGIDPIGHARILWWTTRFGNVSEIDGAPSSRLKAQISNVSPHSK